MTMKSTDTPSMKRPYKKASKELKAKRRADRLWKHWLHWLGWNEDPKPPVCRASKLEIWPDYDPEQWRKAWEKFQTYGRSRLTPEEVEGIGPLLAAQRQKEFFLTGIVEESLEMWANDLGWMPPLEHSLMNEKDRLTKVAILRIIRGLKKDSALFFIRHPKIRPDFKERLLYQKFGF